MSNPEQGKENDIGAVLILVALALIGLIPWVSTLFGRPPAYTAELGAVVTTGALFLLVPTLWEIRRAHLQRRAKQAHRRDGQP